MREMFEKFRCTQLLEFDACTRCNECIEWCPVYQEIKEGRFVPWDTMSEEDKLGFSPKYRVLKMREMLNKKYGLRALIFGPREITKEELEKYKDQTYMCTTCGTCRTVCESRLDTVSLWETTREMLVSEGIGPYGKQSRFLEILKSGNMYEAEQKDRLCWLPSDIEFKKEAEVAYFVGCTAAFRAQKVAVASVRVLDELGIPFTLLGEDELCCGSVLMRTGQASSLVESYVMKNIENLRKRGVKRVVFSCAGCMRTATLDWPKYWGGPLPFETLTLPQYILQLIGEGYDLNLKPVRKRVTYHDPCHTGRHLGIYEPPRRLLRKIPELELVEMKRTRELQRCCGAGGGVKAGNPQLALTMSQRRIEDAIEIGAEMIVSTCPFCRRNLRDGIKEMGVDIEMEDLMVIIAEAMGLDTEVPENPYLYKG